MDVSNLTIEWLHEDRVLYVKMAGELDDNSFLKVDDILSQYLDGYYRQIHIVFDNSEVKSIPSVRVYNKLQFTDHPNLGWGVSFGDTPLTRFFMRAFTQMNKVYFHACESYDDCLAFLGQVDKSLGGDAV
jgi:hypothetical protein